ncbi:hypothetical protein HDU76_001025, partial [Blyttiomyces sp. JEL0837]
MSSLFITRAIRMFAYGSLGVVLALYLRALGMTDTELGLFLSLTLVGDAVISLYVTAHADGWGRRKMLILGSALMMFAGVAFAIVPGPNGMGNLERFIVVTIVGTIGVISPSGHE